MSRRDWHFVAAGIGLAVLALVYGIPLLADHYQDARRADYAATQEYEKSKRIAPFGSTAVGQDTDYKSYRDEWRAERDLHAQEAMARWAKWLLIATVVGVLLLAATLYETRKAAQAAFRMADIADDTAYRELRAYVNGFKGSVVITPSLSSWNVKAEFFLRNSGKTPAIIRSYYFKVDTYVDLASGGGGASQTDDCEITIGPDSVFRYSRNFSYSDPNLKPGALAHVRIGIFYRYSDYRGGIWPEAMWWSTDPVQVFGEPVRLEIFQRSQRDTPDSSLEWTGG
jgi:hypothetical protein